MKEKKERGKYKQYLFNKNINVPKTSKWRAKKDKESQSTSNQFQFTEEQIESNYQHQFDPNLVQQSKEKINNSSDDLEFESENENENTNVSSSAEFESENDNQNDDSNEEINEELDSFILNKEFTGLTKILDKNSEPLIHNKFWYCGTCHKKLDQLTSRFQRLCSDCTTKYIIFL